MKKVVNLTVRAVVHFTIPVEVQEAPEDPKALETKAKELFYERSIDDLAGSEPVQSGDWEFDVTGTTN